MNMCYSAVALQDMLNPQPQIRGSLHLADR